MAVTVTENLTTTVTVTLTDCYMSAVTVTMTATIPWQSGCNYDGDCVYYDCDYGCYCHCDYDCL